MPRVKLLVAYDGTDFHGWQRQDPPGGAPLRTVQGVLEDAVAEVIQARVPVVGASRTDAGVHAMGQVASFVAEHRVPIDRLALAINARLPADACVRAAEAVHDGFDPISDCTSKCYRYTIEHGASTPDGALLFERRTFWRTWHRLDAQRMRDTAAMVVGTHDFAAFAHVDHGRESTVRTVHGCAVTEPRPGRIVVEVAGSGFLYNMVRIIAGTLVEAGRGRLEPATVRQALATRDRTLTGPTLPPHGLRLEWITYIGRTPSGGGA
jgi:tRNA pseudouridine38-40 synthase